MFTGIIELQTPIIAIDKGTFTVHNPRPGQLQPGQSIAHDGACMSLVEITDETYTFFAMEESLRKTNFGSKNVGDTFNLERCLRMGDRLDGHRVTGHIDTTGIVKDTQHATDGSLLIEISFAPERGAYIVPKGSIAINGVSLTVVDVTETSCTIWLIPLTQEVTNVGTLTIDQTVNIEVDLLAKYILKQKNTP